jgi:hypothetical protein
LPTPGRHAFAHAQPEQHRRAEPDEREYGDDRQGENTGSGPGQEWCASLVHGVHVPEPFLHKPLRHDVASY